MESRTLKERRREAEMGRDHTGHSLEIHQALRQEAFQRWLNRGGEHTVCQARKSQSPELSRMRANDGEWRPPPLGALCCQVSVNHRKLPHTAPCCRSPPPYVPHRGSSSPVKELPSEEGKDFLATVPKA